jgi:hypothetical protein
MLNLIFLLLLTKPKTWVIFLDAKKETVVEEARNIHLFIYIDTLFPAAFYNFR